MKLNAYFDEESNILIIKTPEGFRWKIPDTGKIVKAPRECNTLARVISYIEMVIGWTSAFNKMNKADKE